jgi:O-antigen ligase
MAAWLEDVFIKRRGSSPVAGLSIPWVIKGALLVFVCLIPLESLGHDETTSSFTITRMAGVLLVASCIYRPRLILRRPELITGLGFLLMTIALIRTFFIEPDQLAYAFGRYVTWLQMLVFFHIATPILAEAPNRILAVYAYIAGACLTAVLLLMGFGLNVVMQEKDRTSLGNLDPNIQASVLGLAAIWLIPLLLNNRQPIKKPWFLLLLPLFTLLVSAVLLTGSRGGLIALMTAFIPVLFTRSASPNSMAKIAILVVGLFVVTMIVFHNEGMMSRLQHFIYEGDTAGRDYLFSSSLDLWLKRPWLGWGLGANEEALGGYTNTFLRDMHNIYLYILTAAGVVGGGLLAGMIFRSFKSVSRMPDLMLRQVALSGLVLVFVSGSTITILFLKFFWLALACATPIVWRVDRALHPVQSYSAA